MHTCHTCSCYRGLDGLHSGKNIHSGRLCRKHCQLGNVQGFAVDGAWGGREGWISGTEGGERTKVKGGMGINGENGALAEHQDDENELGDFAKISTSKFIELI